jgi:hypothetical protein
MRENRIVGAVVVYLLLAILFAFLFALIERLSSGAFVMGQEPSASSWTGWRFFYLSMITLSSLGLSDITPVHPLARSLVMLEALLGQLYSTVLLARLVSLEVAHRIRNAPLEMRLDNQIPRQRFSGKFLTCHRTTSTRRSVGESAAIRMSPSGPTQTSRHMRFSAALGRSGHSVGTTCESVVGIDDAGDRGIGSFLWGVTRSPLCGHILAPCCAGASRWVGWDRFNLRKVCVSEPVKAQRRLRLCNCAALLEVLHNY